LNCPVIGWCEMSPGRRALMDPSFGGGDLWITGVAEGFTPKRTVPLKSVPFQKDRFARVIVLCVRWSS
jgi:hypothetical protein